MSVPVPVWRFQFWRNKYPSFGLCSVLLSEVGVLHLFCVLFALGGLSGGAMSRCLPGEGGKERWLADVWKWNGYNRRRKLIYRYSGLYSE